MCYKTVEKQVMDKYKESIDINQKSTQWNNILFTPTNILHNTKEKQQNDKHKIHNSSDFWGKTEGDTIRGKQSSSPWAQARFIAAGNFKTLKQVKKSIGLFFTFTKLQKF